MSNGKTPNEENQVGEADVGSSEFLLVQERKRNDDLLTRLKYVQADLENYRKRAERETRETVESTMKDFVRRLLTVQDELELAVKHSEKQDGTEVRDGIEMVRKNLWATLESVGVERIEAVGKPFDPALHEAVEKVQGTSPGEDLVVAEIRPGFKFRGQLLRPSMVKVELAKQGAQQEAKASE